MKSTWQTKKLIEICREITDGSHFSPDSSTNGPYPYITVKDIENDSINFENCKFIDKCSYEELFKNGCQPNLGDLLFSKDGTVGKVALVNFEKDFVVLSSLAIIRPNHKIIDSLFLKYVLKSPKFFSIAIGHKTGVAIKRIILRNLKVINITFPRSLKEQKRIVKILDEVFEKIQKAKENTEKNLQNSHDLFESYLQSVFENKGKDCGTEKLKEVCDKLFAGGDVPKNNLSKIKTEKCHIPIFANGFKDKGLYGYTDIKKVIEPSITISARGTIGYAEIRKEPFYPVVRLIVLTPNLKIIDLSFLYYVVRNFRFSNTGTSIPQLTIPMIENIKIPIPSIQEQKTIVKKLDSLSAETKKLEEIYKQKLANLRELKKSILSKAFSGEL